MATADPASLAAEGLTLEAWAEGVMRRDRPSVARALNLVEDRRPEQRVLASAFLRALSPRVGHHRVGLTGPPGVGKSTLASALVRAYRHAGRTVGVLAVDPSSPRSRGALLGDRVRMALDPGDDGVFVRSLATAGEVGGLSRAIDGAARVLSAAYDRVLIETTGVGQTETDIAHLADTVVFIVQPGSGDVLQFLKAGIMEVPDVVVVNKLDQGALALAAARDVESALRASQTPSIGADGEVPVLRVSARDAVGIAELVAAIEEHRVRHLPQLSAHRRRGALAWTRALLARRYGDAGVERLGGEGQVVAQIERLLDAGASADEIVVALGEELARSAQPGLPGHTARS